MKLLALLLTLACVVNAQTTHLLPFASSGNTIELAVANTSSLSASEITVRVTNTPLWLRFDATAQRIASLRAEEEVPVSFNFAVDNSAPVNQLHTLRFEITSPGGERWTKAITVAIAPPEQFELFQNYPNPFNPTTTVSYQLSSDSRVSLKVFDLLGREVATLVQENQPAGFHQTTFDAGALSSGTYVYQLVTTGEHGDQRILRKTMLLLK
ncbi:MAG: T9SS type A sorting domain-containing protein [Ignavibacteria bacterium]|nr:T9SS type A sorting domain-containing protein [Ignavibacteria bacterium]